MDPSSADAGADETARNLSQDHEQQQNHTTTSSAHSTIVDDSNDTPTKESAAQHAAPQDPEAARTTLETTVIMFCLCASVFLAALDTTIVTTALPTISEYFHSSAGYTWIGSAYLLANAASTPSWGKFSDIWGRKPVLLCASAVFFIGSVLSATSVSIGMLITARAIQGIGGGGLIILANICISDLFSVRNRGQYFAFIGATWALASAVGPILGGVFTEKVSWRWCFYINRTVTILLFFFLKLENPRTPVWEGLKAVDWTGSLTVVGGTLMLLLGLEFGGVSFPWNSATVICLIVFGVFTNALFFLNEWKFAKYPVMPVRLFNNITAVTALACCFCHGYVFISGTYYLPLYFQAVIGATPLLSGVYLLPFAISLSVISIGTGIFIKKTGAYLPPIWFGFLVMTLGVGLFIDLPASTDWARIIIFQIIFGIGVGPNFQAPLIALQSVVEPRDIAAATATFGFVRNISTAISVVIGSVVFQNQMEQKVPALTSSLGPSLAGQLSGGSAGASVGLVQSLPGPQREVARDAFWSSLRTMWIMYVAFSALGLFLSAFIGKHVLSKEHQVTKTGLAAEEEKRRDLGRKRVSDMEQANKDEEKVMKDEEKA